MEKNYFSPGSPARKIIQAEFNLPKWKPFRKWFFKSFSKEDKRIIQERFYEELEDKNVKIAFVPWFIMNYVEN